jgi:hypothetical protein
VQDNEEKFRNLIISHTTDDIVAHEIQTKEKITTTKENFEKLIATLKGAQHKV